MNGKTKHIIQVLAFMKYTRPSRILLFFLFLAGSFSLFSQDEETDDETLRSHPRKSKILTGLYVGSYFANKYSANAYNGYGYDVDGNRNSFDNSLMKFKIQNEYGGAWGRDYVAEALGVDQGRWKFTESDMPFNMRYTPAIMVGVNFKISVAKRSSLLLNINGTKLNVEGSFSIQLDNPASPNPAVNKNTLYFPITGSEQRLLCQLGFQQLLGGDEKFNFLVEGGLLGTLAKFDRNVIYINSLQINLYDYTNQTLYYSPYPTTVRVGFALGAFAGLGVNFDVNAKFIIQFLYTPSYERINIGTDSKQKLQSAIGIRMYYKFKNAQRVPYDPNQKP